MRNDLVVLVDPSTQDIRAADALPVEGLVAEQLSSIRASNPNTAFSAPGASTSACFNSCRTFRRYDDGRHINNLGINNISMTIDVTLIFTGLTIGR